jgi:hypothetical protein
VMMRYHVDSLAIMLVKAPTMPRRGFRGRADREVSCVLSVWPLAVPLAEPFRLPFCLDFFALPLAWAAMLACGGR